MSWTKSYPKEEKIQLPLGVRGAKAAALFSIFGTDKQILFAKQVLYFNFKIIVWLNSMHNTVETVDHLLELCDKQVVSTIILTINSVT